MALGFDVVLIGVPRFSYKDRRATAWRCDPPWFDGWELARDPRMRGNGYPLTGLFAADEVRQLHARFSQRVRSDGSIAPTPIEAHIVSDGDDGFRTMPDTPPPTTVAELDALLAAPSVEWIIISLWDRS